MYFWLSNSEMCHQRVDLHISDGNKKHFHIPTKINCLELGISPITYHLFLKIIRLCKTIY